MPQSAFFDFCAGNRHQIMAGARRNAGKIVGQGGPTGAKGHLPP